MILEEVKQRIENKADEYGFVVPYDGSNNFYKPNAVEGFTAGAEYGYGLAQEEIHTLSGFLKERIKRDDERQAEIARLTAQNEKMRECLRSVRFMTDDQLIRNIIDPILNILTGRWI